MKTEIKVGMFVLVVGEMVGMVEYITADNYIGVRIVNEKGRIDEWQASQCKPITPEGAARIARK